MPSNPPSCHIALNGQHITYQLRRSARKTLGLSINQHGLTVSLPQHVSLIEAEVFLHNRSDWILTNLKKWAERTPRESFSVHDGSHFPLLGQPCSVSLQSGKKSAAHWSQGLQQHNVTLHLRPQDDAKTALLRALQKYALGYFGGRLEEYGWSLQELAPQLTLPPLGLSNARTRWGSCSKKSGIRLNWRLIHLPHAQLDYVVAHELAHLLEMNHSARFWAIVEALYPDYKTAEKALKNAHKIIPNW